MPHAAARDPRRLLDAVPFLAGLPEGARDRLAAVARPARWAVGESLFRRGDPAEGMAVVLDGLVRVHLSTAGGRELTLALVGPGEPVGEVALVDDGPRSADATALTPVSALLLCRAEARAVVAADSELACLLLRSFATRLRRTTEQVEAVGLQGLPQRLAGTLLRLAAADPCGLVRLPQGQIATIVAASRQRVNTTLAEFRARGLVAPARVGLRLTDPDGLRALAAEAD
jgi:CRP/FNR family transcriptional regulator, cyclic AMP receptor protein